MSDPINLFDYETLARERLDPMVYDYYASGAHDEISLRANREAYDRIALAPRVLAGAGERDASIELLGERHPLPLLVAPMAFARMAHDDGELAIARAAGAAGVTMTLSTLSNTSIEDVATAATGPLWFQLYIYRDRGATQALVERAEAAGYRALVVTVDAPLLGRRERDARNRFHLPAGLIAANVLGDGMSEIDERDAGSSLNAYFAELLDPSLTWDAIEWLRGITALPVLVKGVLRPDDAARAVDHGAAGVIVSNHGGRQLDTSIATIDALPAIAEAVAGRIEVLVDGGVRRGADIAKALALGARAVLVGRPVMWGLAVGGEQGVAHVLAILRDEFDLAMALLGCSSVDEITPDLIAG